MEAITTNHALKPCKAQLFLAPSEAFQEAMAKIQDALKARLPHHMIPDLFLPVEEIPLTISGKCDRQYLREQVSSLSSKQIDAYLGHEATDTKLMPSTFTEKLLQSIWSEILDLPLGEIGINDTWTRLGGDSISAMKLVAQARSVCYPFTVSDILRYKTIHALAQLADRRKASSDKQNYDCEIRPFELLVPDKPSLIEHIVKECKIKHSALEDAYPIVGLQHDILYLVEERQSNLTMRLEFRMPCHLDRALFAKAWDRAVEANPVLRTRAVKAPTGEYLQAVVREALPLSIIPESCEDGDPISDGGRKQDIWGFGRSLFHGTLRGDSLLILIHHFIFDGYSWPLILHEIERAYRGEKTRIHSFAPFVKWANQVNTFTRQFWINKFAGLGGLPFPPLREEGSIPMENRIVEGLFSIIPDDYTVAIKMRVALAITISWYHQTPDILLGIASSRRSVAVPGAESIPGPTAQLLPDRVQLRLNESVKSNLDRIQEETLTTMDYEQIAIRDMAGLSPDAARACQFQTILSLQNEKDISDDSIFREWHMPTYGVDAAWNLKINVYMSPGTARVEFHLSDSTLPPDIDWQRFHDQLGDVFGLVQKRPHFSVEEVIALVFDVSKS